MTNILQVVSTVFYLVILISIIVGLVLYFIFRSKFLKVKAILLATLIPLFSIVLFYIIFGLLLRP